MKVDINQSNKELEKIITIKAINVGRPNSASGVDFSIQWKNTSNKIIKYIFFEAVPYNAVGDIVNGEISRSSYFRGKITGPIKQKKRKTSYWSSAWYNRTIKRIEIVKIDIEYSDGSKMELSADEIQKVISN